MGVKDEIGRVEYHYGFYGAIHVQYEPTHVRMEYRQEYELGSEPVRMDMLILKHDQTPLTDPIGRFFKKHNVLEYKSPLDSLSIDDFYKAQGYALLYKGLGRMVDEIPLEELTVSLFRHAYPRALFAKLESQGLFIEPVHPGVYHLSGAISVPTQVVVTSRLPRGEYEAFHLLAEGADKMELLRLLELTEEYPEPGMIEYVRAVLNVSISINERLFREIKEAGIMTDAINRIFKKEMEERENKGRKEGNAEGRDERSLEVATDMLQDGEPLEKIKKYSKLSESAVRNLAERLGVVIM